MTAPRNYLTDPDVPGMRQWESDQVAAREPKRLALIKRLCKLQAEVLPVVGYAHAADCFCRQPDEGEYSPRMYQWSNAGKAVDFIEQAVREKLGRLADADATAQAILRRRLAALASREGVKAEDLAAALEQDQSW